MPNVLKDLYFGFSKKKKKKSLVTIIKNWEFFSV